MAETLAAKLTRVQTAIAAIEATIVQSSSIQGRSLTYAQEGKLEVLYKREKQLLSQIEGTTRIRRTVAEM